MMELIKHNGQRGKSFYSCGNYKYHESKAKPGVKFYCALRTAKRQCRVILTCDVNGKVIVDESRHNHGKTYYPNKLAVIEELKLRSAENLPVKKIVKQVLSRFPNANVTKDAAQKIIFRQRRQDRPSLPQNCKNLPKFFKNYKLRANLYYGRVRVGDKVAIFLGSDPMFDQLNVCTEISIHCSSQSLPPAPKMQQLLTINMKKYNKGVPGMYILCSSRSKDLYELIWRRMNNMLPEFKKSLKTIVCDFDEQLVSSLRLVFEDVEIRGSLFHFLKMKSRVWQTQELPETFQHEVIKMAWAVVLLPEDKVKKAVKILKKTAQTNPVNSDDLQIFVHFLKTKCLPLMQSQYFIDENAPNAVNISEESGVHMERELGLHEDFFKFLEKLQCQVNDFPKKWSNEKELKKNNSAIRISKEISEMQRALKKGTMSLEDFLKSAIPEKMIEEIILQLSWPNFANDAGTSISIPTLENYTPRVVEQEEMALDEDDHTVNICENDDGNENFEMRPYDEDEEMEEFNESIGEEQYETETNADDTEINADDTETNANDTETNADEKFAESITDNENENESNDLLSIEDVDGDDGGNKMLQWAKLMGAMIKFHYPQGLPQQIQIKSCSVALERFEL